MVDNVGQDVISGPESNSEFAAGGISASGQISKRKAGCSRFLWVLLVIPMALALSAIPNAETPGAFATKGLGMTRAQWNQRYSDMGSPSGLTRLLSGYTTYSGGSVGDAYDVWFWPEGLFSQNNGRISAIEHFVSGLSPEEARTEARSLMPDDAQLKETVQKAGADSFYDIFHSASLETRY